MLLVSSPLYGRLATTRLARNSSRRALSRLYVTAPSNDPRKSDRQESPTVTELPTDPRPRWMFTTAAFLRIVLIPAGFIYAIFFHDFGEEEHVFMPPRRWLQRQKRSLFTLSPAERGLVKDDEADKVDDTRQQP